MEAGVSERVAVGVDAGASLVKLALQEGAALRHELIPATELDRVAERVTKLGPRRLGLTGAGARRAGPPPRLRERARDRVLGLGRRRAAAARGAAAATSRSRICS